MRAVKAFERAGYRVVREMAESAGFIIDFLDCPSNRHYLSDEEAVMVFSRITTNPQQMGGVPCVRGLRIPVATVVELIAQGMTPSEILADYPDLGDEDIRECLRFAAEAVREPELPMASGS